MIDNTSLRFLVFITILIVMILFERRFPARTLTTKKRAPTQLMRLIGNWGLVIISGIVSRLILPAGLAGFAFYCSEQQWGVLNIIHLPDWLTILFSLALLDMLIYWQHRLFHKVPLLWRLHQVHHADPHIDSSSALRFHPIEIILSLIIKGGAVVIMGIPAFAVILFEVLLNGFAIFNHANIRLPRKSELILRQIIVTQVLHRIHHSQIVRESNCNFGFSVIWWDKLFGSYAGIASKADNNIDIGLAEYPDAKQNAHLWGLLVMPFQKKK